MKKCKLAAEVMKEAKQIGLSTVEQAMMRELLKAKKEGKFDASVDAEGKVNWHVTTENWQVAGLRSKLGLGLLVGSREHAKKWHKDLPKRKKVYLHKVENISKLNTLDIGDVDLEDVQAVQEAVQEKTGIEASGVEELREELLAVGYDGIATDGDSMLVMDTGKIDDSRIEIGYAKELLESDFEAETKEYYEDIVDNAPTYANTLYEVFRGQLPLRFNGARTVTWAKIQRVQVDMDTMETTVVTSRGTYTFAQGQDRSKDTKTGKYVVVDGLGHTTNGFISREHEQARVNEYLESLASTEDGLHVKFEDENEVNAHGNTKKMQKLLEQLNEVDANPVDAKYLEQLKELVGGMKSEFFTQMKTYIQTGAESVGRITPDRISVQVSNVYKMAGNTMSAAEVYAHELVHAYTMFGLRDKERSTKIRRELRYLRETLAKEVNWTVFLPKESVDYQREAENAKKMWKYVFENDTQEGIDEFIAHVLTNPMLSEKAKTVLVREEKVKNTLFDRLTELFGVILDLLRGRYDWSSRDKNVYEEVHALAHRLGEINNKALVARNEKQSATKQIVKWFNGVEKKVSDKLKETIAGIADKAELSELPTNATNLQYAKWLVQNMAVLITKPELRPTLETILTSLGMKPEGLVQNVLRDFREPDQLERWLDKMNMLAGRIDSARKAMIMAVAENVQKGFSRKLTTEEEELLTEVLVDNDVQSLLEEYTLEEIGQLLADEEKVYAEISKIKSKLKSVNPKMYNWFTNQARGLGYFMATGKANEAQSLNAQNIATGVLLVQQREATKEEIDLIDRLATLEALAYTDVYSRKKVAKLVEEEATGVLNVLETHKGFVEASKDTVFQESTTNMVKGYSREIFNDSVDIVVKPLSKKEDMLKQGYEIVREIAADEDLGLPKMAVYKAKTFNRQEYYRTATRLTAMSKRGTSLTELTDYTKADMYANKMKVDTKKTKIAGKMLVQQVDVEKLATNRVPLLNDSGEIVDYRFMMSKRAKKEILEQDKAVSKVLGRSVANIADKVSTNEHNKKVLDIMLDEMQKNYIPGFLTGQDGHEYVEIGPDVRTKEGRELWRLMPKAMRLEIKQRTGHKLVAVRRDMLLHYFGFRHLTVANAGLVKQLPTALRTALKALEQLWQAVVSIAKVDILIRVPMVVIGNLVSNFMFGVMTGTGPIELAKMYVEQARNIREYMNKHKEYTRLIAVKQAGNVLKEDLSALPRLKADLEANPIHELMEAGIYESIVEDLSEEDAKTNNVIGKYLQEKTKNLPEGVKTTWNWLTLNEHTAWYKNMEMLLRMGDLLGQATENEKRKVVQKKELKKLREQLVKDGLKGAALEQRMASENARLDKERLEGISDDFIFYSKPSSAVEEYLNRMGVLMFTKYAKRIQRVISKTATDYPLRSMLVALADNSLFNDGLETIMDQSLVDRSWYNFGVNPLSLVERTVPIAVRMTY